jgi:hypothetical protein
LEKLLSSIFMINISLILKIYKNPITKDDILLNFEECINSSILLINSIKEYFTSK